MKILFFTSSTEDYLGDSILHGLRTIYGEDCVDFPKCEALYKNCSSTTIGQVRGKGFTLYSGLLDDIEIDRFNIAAKITKGYFDLIIISDIQRQFGWFVQFRPWLNSKNTIILDGADTHQPYPARGFWWRRPYFWFLPKAHKKFLYFKREWTSETHFNLWMRAFPKSIRKYFPQPINLRTVSFGIPEEKIVNFTPGKTKNFPKHIVDPEVASIIPRSFTSYAFDCEKDYYEDLQRSRFGITTKRSGWDCLRHYEIAANGAVPCFRNLHLKSITCAPHGLNLKNTIFYKNADDLMRQINNLSPEEYTNLQAEALKWVRENTTIKRALSLIRATDLLSKKNEVYLYVENKVSVD